MKCPYLFLAAVLIFCGCAQFRENISPKNSAPGDKKIQARNNAASLLAELLHREKNVSKLLIVKKNSDALGRLIDAVSKTANDGEKQLETLVKNDPTLNLHAIELPAGEVATRDAIAHTREKELLFTSGEKFEFNLLLTQAEATSYGSHLAKIAAENSPPSAAAREFQALDLSLNDLFEQIVARMRSLPAK